MAHRAQAPAAGASAPATQAAPAQSPPAPPPLIAAPGSQPRPAPPWWAKLGMRALEVEFGIPVLDQVVLVPDEAAFLREIGRWTTKARWPVLIEDTAFAPRFIRAFKPSVVLRRGAADEPFPADRAARRAAIEAAVVRAWGGSPGTDTPSAAIRRAGLVPPGIVVTSTEDPSWTAAVALAAGRGQPIAWIDQPFAGPGAVLDTIAYGKLDSAIRQAFEQSGWTWESLGDDLDTLTLCRNAPLKVDLALPPGGHQPQLPADDKPLSLSDALCRQPDGARYAFVGQVFGEPVRSAALAMCSLFLRREEVWTWDGYAGRNGGAGFAPYAMDRTDPVLLSEGYRVKQWDGPKAGVAAWRALLSGGIAPDVMLVNSSGNSDFFELAATAKTWATDVPVLREPIALDFIHSFSLQFADSLATVGGRWLEHGAYCYAGSVQEPYVVAFIPTSLFAQRIAAGTPFLVAARQWQGDLIPTVWRVATVGDPLMTAPSPKVLAGVPGRLPAAVGADYADVRIAARDALERAKGAADDATAAPAFRDAMRDLVACGDDALAAKVWLVAKARGPACTAAAAHAALAPLFRTGDRTGFMAAWPDAGKPTPEESDMLWHLWTAELPNVRDRAVLGILKANLRAPREDMDAELLAPAVRAAEGRDAAVAWLNAAIQRADHSEAKRRMAELQVNVAT